MKATAKTRRFRKSFADQRKQMQPKAIQVAAEDLVEIGPLHPDQPLPLLVRPRMASVDLPSWLRDHYDFVEKTLNDTGGILFRDFDLRGEEGFGSFLEALPFELLYYMEGATPRTQLSDKVYTSTEFPPDQTIALHCELCYRQTWPLRILFFCETAPPVGGETPTADMRKVHDEIPREIRQRFADKGGWLLVRNFNEKFGLPWQVSYRVDTREELEAYFRGADIQWEWLDGGERLRTQQVRPVVETHPKTGEQVWFTHVAFWHLSALEPHVREVMLRDFGEDGLPYNTYYGDGTPIEEEAIAAITEAYDRSTVMFPWQVGDLLLLDNMLVAHGRSPFEGPRKILTAMGEACHRQDLH